MKINHEAETLLECINTTEEALKDDVLEIFHTIRIGTKLSDDELIKSIAHFVAGYNGHTLCVLPALGTIYGLNTKEYLDITKVDFSYQLEAIITYASMDIRDFIANQYFFTVLNDVA